MLEQANRSVLFVCMGNYCRSPAAEGLLRHFASRHGLESAIEIDSAGTHGFQIGKPPDIRMRAAAAIRGYHLEGQSRQITTDDLTRFDLVVAMDKENLSTVQAMHDQPKSEFKLFSHFLESTWPTDVPDPFQGSKQDFEIVLDMLEAGCPNILNYLSAQLETK